MKEGEGVGLDREAVEKVHDNTELALLRVSEEGTEAASWAAELQRLHREPLGLRPLGPKPHCRIRNLDIWATTAPATLASSDEAASSSAAHLTQRVSVLGVLA